MKKQKQEIKHKKKTTQLEQPQRLENMEFGEEFTFDQKRRQPTNLENDERRNHRK